MSPSTQAALREAVLHIGLGKAGTTSVQLFLFRNRARLAELGLLNPVSPGRRRHVQLGHFVRTRAELSRSLEWQRLEVDSIPDWRRDFRRRLNREIARAGLPRAIFTDEDLFSSSERAIGRMHQLMGRLSESVRVVTYLRRQDDHMVSRYQQAVRVGEVARLDEYAARDWAWKYDYGSQLARWQGGLEPERIVVRRFEPGRFAGGSLYQDFLDAIDVDVRAADLTQVEATNPSLDLETSEVMRLMNIHRVEHEGATPYLIDNRRLGTRLRALDTGGPTLTLPEADLDRFMKQWRATNRTVARRFLGEEELFREPRKTRNTSSHQHLEPERLAHYLDALEVPAAERASLERIARREYAEADRGRRRWRDRVRRPGR